MSDLRYALRTLINNRGFTGVAALTLALGIGATTLVFSVMDAAILRPLPCPSPDQLVIVLESHPQRGLMAVRAANYLGLAGTDEGLRGLTHAVSDIVRDDRGAGPRDGDLD
jgi:hypothetical protein